MRLKDKVIAITGSGSGLGRESALLFAAEGATLVVSDVVPGRAQAVAKEIVENGGTAIGIDADVRSEADMDNLVATTVDHYGRIDVMWGNAGVPEPGFGMQPLHKSSLEDWNNIFAVNTTGIYLAWRAAARWMIDNKRPGTLLPADPRTRDEALALEDRFDRDLGPATRRWGYYYVLPRKDLDHLLVRGVPRWEAFGLRIARPLAVRMLVRGMKIDEAGVERSRQKIEETFAAVDALLADGRAYLAGDRFSVADLALAALAAPVVFPAEHPKQVATPADLTPGARSAVEAWRDRPAGRHVLAMYARYRA